MGQRSWPVRAAVIAAIVLLAGLSFVAGRGQANGVAAIVGIPASAILLPLGRTWQRSWNHPPGTTYVLEAGVHRGQVLVPDVGDTIVGQAGGMLSGAEPVERGAFTRDGERWVLDGRREEPIENGEVDPGFEGDRSAYELWAGVVGLRHVAGRDAVDEPGGWASTTSPASWSCSTILRARPSMRPAHDAARDQGGLGTAGFHGWADVGPRPLEQVEEIHVLDVPVGVPLRGPGHRRSDSTYLASADRPRASPP